MVPAKEAIFSGYKLLLKTSLLTLKLLVRYRYNRIKYLQILARFCPGSLHPIKCDVSKEDQVVAMFNEIQTLYGGVDILINNAGLGHNQPLLTGTCDQWKHMFDVIPFFNHKTYLMHSCKNDNNKKKKKPWH